MKVGLTRQRNGRAAMYESYTACEESIPSHSANAAHTAFTVSRFRPHKRNAPRLGTLVHHP